MNNQEFLKRKSDAANIIDISKKLQNVNQNRANYDAETLNKFIHTQTQRERQINNFKRIENKKQKEALEKKE